MDILQALQIAWLIQQLTINAEQFWASLPPELTQALGSNQALTWVAIGVAVIVGLKLVTSVFDS